MPVSATGVSADARAFARSIEEGSVPKTDMAIYANPTTPDVYIGQMGFILCHVTLVGKISLLRHPARVAPDGGA